MTDGISTVPEVHTILTKIHTILIDTMTMTNIISTVPEVHDTITK